MEGYLLVLRFNVRTSTHGILLFVFVFGLWIFVSQGASYASYRVDSGLLSFLGHGCGGTFNAASLNDPSSVTEATADPDTVPQDGLLEVVQELVFNPSITRNSHLPEFVVSSRKISTGEGITSNFVPWYNESGWKSHIESLRSKCSDGV